MFRTTVKANKAQERPKTACITHCEQKCLDLIAHLKGAGMGWESVWHCENCHACMHNLYMTPFLAATNANLKCRKHGCMAVNNDHSC